MKITLARRRCAPSPVRHNANVRRPIANGGMAGMAYRKRKIVAMLFITLAAICMTGCGTLLSTGMNHDPDASHVYSGTRADILIPLVALRVIPTEEELPPWTVAWSLLLLDLPFSFVADTLLLPVTLYHHVAVRGKVKNRGAEEVQPDGSQASPVKDGGINREPSKEQH
jgi:uncharacterized protein YceK